MHRLLLLALIAAASALPAQVPYLVKDINSFSPEIASSSSPSNFIGYAGQVFFAAETHTDGVELWMTDGTAEGTSQLRDIEPGPRSSSCTGSA